jgi:hypothetical protein
LRPLPKLKQIRYSYTLAAAYLPDWQGAVTDCVGDNVSRYANNVSHAAEGHVFGLVGVAVEGAGGASHGSALPGTGAGVFFDPGQNVISAIANVAAQLHKTRAFTTPAGALTPGGRLAQILSECLLIP